MNGKIAVGAVLFCSVAVFSAGCFGGLKKLRVVDLTDQRITDLTITEKVIGKREFLFFSTTRTGIFLEGYIQGTVTDYKGNPIEGITVRAVTDMKAKGDETGDLIAAVEENAASFVKLTFAPGISDTMGLYKIHFALPIIDNQVNIRGKILYNSGWDQQKVNLGKAYEPQMKESPFRLFYNLKNGYLAFAEGVRSVIVHPAGEGKGRMQALPGAKAPEIASPQQEAPPEKTEEDLFKGFDFGQ